jgi:putative nucleotidyltransferase with HDIG domain
VIQAGQFLGSLGRALSTAALYRGGHPILARAVDCAFHDLEALLAAAPVATFTFLGESVLFGDLPLADRRGWEWSGKLAEAGVQRVEFGRPAVRDEFERFLAEVSDRLAGRVSAAASAAPQRIRFGAVGLRGDDTLKEGHLPTATLAFVLDTEIDTVRWVHDEVTDHRLIPLLEVEAVVRSLSVAMHANPQLVLPLVQLKEFDQYTTAHSLNVSVLAMGLAERLDLAPSDIRACGIAGLLHDIGKTLIPLDILTKPGRFSDEERQVMERHPIDGARLILKADQGLDLPAIVAYEHHIMTDGGGYPTLRYRRDCHAASRLVHVCDVFDALRTRRPYRDPWPVEKALTHLRTRAGCEFDPDFTRVFDEMIQESGRAAPPPGPPGSATADSAPSS